MWRVAFAFAFDPKRQAILLVGGDKGGADQRRFYKHLIRVGCGRFLDQVDQVKRMLGRRCEVRPRGRPRKRERPE